MKTKLLKKLRKLAKKAITIECEVFRNDIKYTIYKNKSYYCYCNSKGDAIDNLIKARRGYILQQIDNIREDILNKELSKI